jgi:hypothetical protein
MHFGIELNPEYVDMARRRIIDDASLLNTEIGYRSRRGVCRRLEWVGSASGDATPR